MLRVSSERFTWDGRTPGGAPVPTDGLLASAPAASDGHVDEFVTVRPVRLTAEIELATLHALPLSYAVIDQL